MFYWHGINYMESNIYMKASYTVSFHKNKSVYIATLQQILSKTTK